MQRTSFRSASSVRKSHAQGAKVDSPHPIFDNKKVNTVGAILDAASEIMPDKDLYHHVESYDKWTYKEARGHINAVANGLPEARIPAGKRVAVAQQNDSENFTVRLGALRAGVVPAHIEIKKFHRLSVLDYFDAIQPRSVVLTPKYDVAKKLNHVDKLIPEIPSNWIIGAPLKIKRYPDLKLLFHTHKSKFYDGWYAIKDLFWYDETPRVEPTAKVSPGDIAEWHFPRFTEQDECYDVMKFTHESAVQSAYNWGSVGPFADQRVAFTGEFSHPEVQTSLLSCIAYGSYIVGSTYWFRPTNIIKDMAKEHCSVLVTTPEHLEELCQSSIASTTKNSLETILVINNPYNVASLKSLKKAQEIFKVKEIQVAFIADGCMSPFLHGVVTDKSRDMLLGSPIPNTEVKVVNAYGEILPLGQPGRVLTKGIHTLKSYEGPNADKVLDSEGWLDTGVKASLQKDGNLILSAGRSKPTMKDALIKIIEEERAIERFEQKQQQEQYRN